MEINKVDEIFRENLSYVWNGDITLKAEKFLYTIVPENNTWDLRVQFYDYGKTFDRMKLVSITKNWRFIEMVFHNKKTNVTLTIKMYRSWIFYLKKLRARVLGFLRKIW